MLQQTALMIQRLLSEINMVAIHHFIIRVHFCVQFVEHQWFGANAPDKICTMLTICI